LLFKRKPFAAPALVLAIATILPATSVLADPPVRIPVPPPPPAPIPIPGTFLPSIFCFRITDIGDTAASNTFKFMFEVLNWANKEAHGLALMINKGSDTKPGERPPKGRPLFKQAKTSVDEGGRPLGNENDDDNFPPRDQTNLAKFKIGQSNTWSVTRSTSTMVMFSNQGGSGFLPARDVLSAVSQEKNGVKGSLHGTTAACNLVPGCAVSGLDTFGRATLPVVSNMETVDNGAPTVDNQPDNVLDGFVVEIKDFDEGELISFNWFLIDKDGNQIGSSGFGNDMGFGTFNIRRLKSNGERDCANLDDPEDFKKCMEINGSGTAGPKSSENRTRANEAFKGNTGVTQNIRDMFIHDTESGVQFAVEPGPGITAPFLSPQDNIFDVEINAPLIAPYEDCIVYVLHDGELNNTQLFTVLPDINFEAKTLGPVYEGYDIEGLDIHPNTSKLYATSGDDPSKIHANGFLYEVNMNTGGLIPVGSTSFGEVSAISFHPQDGTLWGWADGEGLIQINPATGDSSLVLSTTLGIEDVTWSQDGTKLYGIENTTLYEYDKGVVKVKCNNFPSQVEALDMYGENTLLFGLHKTSDTNIHLFNIDTCSIDFSVVIDTPYDDIEGITWVCRAP
jgi:hypothetical protein